MKYPDSIPCFWIERTNRVQVGLRRYCRATNDESCPREDGRWGFHGALVIIDEIGAMPAGDGHVWGSPEKYIYPWPHYNSGRWPTHCECGYAFTPEDEWQRWIDLLWQRPDTGERFALRDVAPGAMWDADWYPWKGPDGRCLVVKCPGGTDWIIDGRASNCTKPGDSEHRCWVRHGEPPLITVDKNGLTCAAGAGSIFAGDYHGFLRDGAFTPA